jgi:hypothetical protein
MFLETIDEPGAEGELERWYDGQRELWGYLPNYAAAFAVVPRSAMRGDS